MINSKCAQNIHYCSHKTNGGAGFAARPHAVDMVYRTHVKPQNSKRDIRQGKLLPISVYLELALQEVIDNGY